VVQVDTILANAEFAQHAPLRREFLPIG